MYIVTKTTAYGITNEDPETEILLVTDNKSEAESIIESEAENCGYDAYTYDDSTRWVDEDQDLLVLVEIHTFDNKRK